ncbi:thioesterase family protein [Granulosicoccaceae sp. 1_MG-2023]|nr:thioesterase family protein [Granulosicoccaceae sp. 1_MG-2023]
MPGRPCQPRVRLLRAGKSVAHYQGELQQDGVCCTLVTACYGAARDSAIRVSAEQHKPGPLAEGTTLPYTKGVTPAFLQHIDLRYRNGLPYSGTQGRVVNGWMRFKHGDFAITPIHLLALTDVWPPAILQYLTRPVPAATVTWQLDFINSTGALRRQDWLHYEAVIREAHGGYGHTEAQVCSEDGTVLALSRQLVSVFDKPR